MNRVFPPTPGPKIRHGWPETGPSSYGVNELIGQSLRLPFKGIGKPEPLVGDLRAWWSRRITRKHRLVHRLSDSGEAQSLEIAACRFHHAR